MKRTHRAMSRIAAAAVALLGVALPAGADGGRQMPRDMPSAYVQECTACHAAYPPGLLPAQSWKRIMSNLDRHYGTDASLDDATVRQLADWLQVNAGTYKRVAATPPPEDRITRSLWFERKHREIDPAVWRHASVKSAANCAACHTGADRGIFDDDNLRFPPGLDARLRRGWDD